MSKYPVIEVGDPVTADMLNAMLPDIVNKATATLRPSTTAFADDPDLVTPTLAANGTYIVEFSIRYATTTAAGFKTDWTVPAGILSSNRTVDGLGASTGVFGAVDNSPSGTTFADRHGVHGYATSITYGSRNDVTLQCEAKETSVVIMGATPGTVALQWAQATSTAVNTGVFATSFVKVTRIG